MRRSLCKQWPLLTETFGIRPWELRLLTAEELDAYVTWISERQKARRKAVKKRRTRR